MFWRRLPQVAHRRLGRRVIPKFGVRLGLFFVMFCLGFGSYVMSFVLGLDWGVGYGHRCKELCEWLTGRLSELLGRAQVPILGKVGDGIARLASNDMAAVIATSFLFAIATVVAVSAVSVLVSFVRMFMGSDGSQAELYDEDSDIAGVRSDAAERRRRRAWRPDVSENPYSVTRV